jgi:putative DNA primase/helicase
MIEDQLKNAIVSAGMTPPNSIKIDGNIHRFRSDLNKRDLSGWYVVNPGIFPCGIFGCWRMGVTYDFKADIGRPLSKDEIEAQRSCAELISKIANREKEQKHNEAAKKAKEIWEESCEAKKNHAYLEKKQVKPYGLKSTSKGDLLIPVLNSKGNLDSLQFISEDGSKKFLYKGRTKGGFFAIGKPSKKIYIAEGYATAASVHEESGDCCFIAFSAGNLKNVASTVREKFKNEEVIIVADNDKSGVGEASANEAASLIGARVVVPPILGDANDYKNAGHNLKDLLDGESGKFIVDVDSFCADTKKPEWYVDDWIPKNSFVMVHGQSGSGKTFVVLDWVLNLASKKTPVIYLAGEGHYGLKRRIKAWMLHNKKNELSMHVSSRACDLDKGAGYYEVVNSLDDIGFNDGVIVVDTLHRFLCGDENSAKDAKLMLDSCNQLMSRFNSTLILVHHTGVQQDAQNRARGSSAWKGALDVEISVKSKPEFIEVSQLKMKDSEIKEPIFCRLESVLLKINDEEMTGAVIKRINSSEALDCGGSSSCGPHKECFEKAWLYSGAQIRENMAYLSRSNLIDYFVNVKKLSEKTANVYVKPSAKGRMIEQLLSASWIDPYEHGWVILNEIDTIALVSSRNHIHDSG